MTIFSFFSLLGGLALFLYGMTVMGSSLEKQAGGRFEKILEKLTSNPFKGVAVGAAVTSVIQSSSATTVMVVGFVNSGIMQLSQAIGIIMGANIGTTITAWILSLSGIQGDSLIIQLLKPTNFAPILAAVGIVMLLSKQNKRKDTGTILLGFTVLMVGMEMMSSAMKPLAQEQSFVNILTLFSNPFLGVLTGFVVTGIIQSSSASVGILQALSITGSITYSTAIPIILGQNIGTCVTALISSVGTNRNAKRAAFVHLYFNVIGTIIFLSLFYILNGIFDFSFMDSRINAMGIAVVHTLFNLLGTFSLLPFTKQLEKLACLTIKSDGDEPGVEFSVLDKRFLATPSFAIAQCKNLTEEMAALGRDMLLRAIALTERFKDKDTIWIEESEKKMDLYEDKIGSYLVELSSKSLSLRDSQEISKLLHIIGDLERIGDHALNIKEVAVEIHDKKMVFSEQAQHELSVITGAIREILNSTVKAFETEDLSLADSIEPLEQVVDSLRSELKTRHIARLQNGECTIEQGFVFLDLLTNYERVADHCSNIAVCLIQIERNAFDTHAYLQGVKNSNSDFFEQYRMFEKKYKIN